MRAVLAGKQGFNWSDPNAWASGMVPDRSDSLNIQLNSGSDEDLGTTADPFVAHDVIGVSAGLSSPPLLFVTGSLNAHTLANVGFLDVNSNGVLFLNHDLVNVGTANIHDGGILHVGHNLVNVQDVDISFGSTVDIGHGVGKTNFSLGIPGATLILDDPAHGALSNKFFIAPNDTIELGRISFDQAEFFPSAPGSLEGKVQLTNHGAPVYQLTNVTEATAGGAFSAGFDHSTGHNFISYHT